MYNLNKKETFVLAGSSIFALGAIAGGLIYKYMDEHRTVHADDILDNVKNQFLKEGPIEGSWIELTQTPIKKAALTTDVYYGGISLIEDDELIQYEFIADAYTGTVIDVYEL